MLTVQPIRYVADVDACASGKPDPGDEERRVCYCNARCGCS